MDFATMKQAIPLGHTSPYLPTSPHISPHLPTPASRSSRSAISPRFSTYLPTSPHACEQVIALGHSRVPVYWGPAKSSITRFIHIKDQLMLTPADATPVASLRFHEPQWARPPRDRREITRDRPRSAEIGRDIVLFLEPRRGVALLRD